MIDRNVAAMFAVCAATLTLLFIPEIFTSAESNEHERLHDIFESSIFYDTLIHSTYLRSAHGCLIASTLPLILDTALDLHLRWSRNLLILDVNMMTSLMFILCNVVPSTVFYVNTTSAIASQMTASSILLSYVAFYSVLVIVISTMILALICSLKLVSGQLLLLIVSLMCSRYLVAMGSVLNPDNAALSLFVDLLLILIGALYSVVCAYWFHDLRKRRANSFVMKQTFKLSRLEYTAVIYRYGLPNIHEKNC
jgi:hypothetical protein